MLIKRVRFIPNKATGKHNTFPNATTATGIRKLRRSNPHTPRAVGGRQVRRALPDAVEGYSGGGVFLLDGVSVGLSSKSQSCLFRQSIQNRSQCGVESASVQNHRVPHWDLDLVPGHGFHSGEDEPVRVT